MATLNVVYRIAADISSMQRDMNRAATSTEKLQAGFRNVGRTIVAGGIAIGVAKIGSAAVRAASEFESSFAGVRKTVNATEEEFAALEQGFRDLAREIPVSVNELNRIGEAAGQLGIETENILSFTRVMADLGVTTNLASDVAATALARIANITRLPQEQFSNLGSSIVELGNNFATTEAEIVDFGLRIAGAGQVAGLTVPDILAIGTALSSVGVQSERGGTAVQKALLGMVQAVSEGGEKLSGFARIANLSASDFATAFREDAAGAFEAFVLGLATQGDKAGAMLEDVGLSGERARGAFLSLAGAGDLLTRTLESATRGFDANVALAVEAEKRYETFASQVQLLKNLFNDLAITTGQLLLPVLSAMVDGLQALLQDEERLRALTLRVAGAMTLLLKSLDMVQVFLRGAQMKMLEFAAAAIKVEKAVVDMALFMFEFGRQLPGGFGDAFRLAQRDVDRLSGASTHLGDMLGALQFQIDDVVEDSRQFGNTMTRLITEIDAASAAAGEEGAALNRVRDAVRDAQDALDDFNTSQSAFNSGGQTSLATLGQMVDGWDAVDVAMRHTRLRLEGLKGTLDADITPSIELFGGRLPAAQLNLFSEAINTTALMMDGATVIVDESTEAVIRNASAVAGGSSAWAGFGNAMQEALGSISAGLGGVIVGALQGGGDVFRAGGAFIGNELGAGIGESVKGLFAEGSKLGSALGGFLGPLGAVAGSALGGLVGKLFNLGGPSELELAGRQTAGSFRDGVIRALSRADAIGVEQLFFGRDRDHAKFLRGIEVQFEAVGFSAEEAGQRTRAFADALFRAEGRGPEAVQAVIDGFEDLIDTANQYRQAETDLAAAITDRDALLRQTLDDGATAWLDFVDSGLAATMEVPDAFRAIIEAQRIVNSEWGPMISGAQAGAKAMLALGTTGNLNQETFRGFERSIRKTFETLLRQGFSGDAALQAMRPTIAALMFAQETYGLQVDTATQKIIDQAAALGITAAEGETAADRQLAAMNELIDSLKELIKLFRDDLPQAITGLPDANIAVRVDDAQLRALYAQQEAFAAGGVFGVPSFAGGSGGFRDFGTGTLALLHGREAVVPEGQLLGGALESEVRGLRQDLRDQNDALASALFRAVRDGELLRV